MDDAFANFMVDRFRYLIDKIDSQHFTDFFCGQKLDEALLKKLKSSMLIIDAVLHDNERKRRFCHLGEVMLDLESLLDDAVAESLLLSFGAKSQPNTNQTGSSISSEFTSLGKSKDQYQQQMESIAEKLEFIVKESLQTTTSKQYLQLPAATDFSNDEFEVIGRDADKEAIIELLLADDVSADQIDVIAITGPSGVGKTTLSQLVYDDNRVNAHFDLKVWICVQEGFDVFRLTKTILEALVTSQPSDVEDLNSLQARLKESLNTKKFLLVLDNFGCDNYSDWETLRSTLSAGRTIGSKIIVTTGISELAAITGTVYAYHLKTLTYEDSWMLFAKHASADKNSSLHPQLEEIGVEIVKSKWYGLPLVAKVVGAALSFKPTVKEWDFVLEFSLRLSDLPDDSISILSALYLSYLYLPTHLKLCFAVCEIFPRGYRFEDMEVILLWLAKGLLPEREHKSMEEVGHDYFLDLTSRCFFQRSSVNRSRFVMHDLLNHLAHFVSGDRPSRLVHPQSLIASRKARKIGSLSSSGVITFVQSFQNLTNLSFSHCGITELPDFTGLRSLQNFSVSDCNGITELLALADSITYLSWFSNGRSKSLESLYSPKSLELIGSLDSIDRLPTIASELVNLCHLFIDGTGLKEMPEDMGKLTNLQILSNSIVGKYGGSQIKELGPLSNLQGTLHISELQNVVFATDASEADLKNKKNLDVLELEWSNTSTQVDWQNEIKVLEQLQPHKTLKELSIAFFSGTRFPHWLGDFYFSKMVFLRLSNCNNCLYLPPVGQLPSLENLIVEQMNMVERVGTEFYRVKYSSVKPFQSLKTLVFQGMLEWREWISPEGIEFPCLQKICIRKCPKLKKSLPKCLPSTIIEISECPELEVTPERLPIIDDMQLYDVGKEEFESNEKLVDRPPRLQVIVELKSLDGNVVQLKSDDEFASQRSEHRTDVSVISHSSPRESFRLFPENSSIKRPFFQLPSTNIEISECPELEVMPPRLPIIDDMQLHDADKEDFESNEKLVDRPLRTDDEFALQPSEDRTDVSITSQSSLRESFEPFPENSSIKHEVASSDSDSDDLIDISSPISMKVSEISQLEELPPRLRILKIEGCDAQKYQPQEVMRRSPHLQHLYIIDCCHLELFQGGHLFDALKSLYIRNCRKLDFLSLEETLRGHALLEHFSMGSSCDSLRCFPLTLFPKLRSLSIWDSANFDSISITENHMSLHAIEIRDCHELVYFPKEGLRSPNLTSILLSNCKNLKVLPDQLYSLMSLQSLRIIDCPELDSIPKGGFPLNLDLLRITSCNKLTPCIGWGMLKLSNLSCFEIEGGCRDLESFPEQKLLPSNLNSLRISRVSNLIFLDSKGLEHLKSLETLEINCCDKLQSLPEEGLPSSLTSLYINECPSLKSKLQNGRGKEWYKIAHIPHIQIDDEVQ